MQKVLQTSKTSDKLLLPSLSLYLLLLLLLLLVREAGWLVTPQSYTGAAAGPLTQLDLAKTLKWQADHGLDAIHAALC